MGESLALRRAIGDKRGVALALGGLGDAEWCRDNVDTAETLFNESLCLHRQIGDLYGEGLSLRNLAQCAFRKEDTAKAALYLAESLADFERVGDRWETAFGHFNLAFARGVLGDVDDATKGFKRSIEAHEECRNTRGTAFAAMGLAWVAYLRGKDGVAGQVLGGCYATLESLGLRPNPVEREWVGRMVADCRARLGYEEWTAVWARGRQMFMDEVTALTLETVEAEES